MMPMKFGVCAGLDEAAAILGAGFDYLEVGASGFNGLDDDWDSTPYANLPILATNLFFDHRIRLFGPERTPYRDYAERTITRGASLGIPVMVIGSGGPRSAPEGVDGDTGFIDIVAEIAEIARPLGVRLAPESLNKTETNVGNDLRRLALGLRDRGVGFTADSYHILVAWNEDGRKLGLDDLMEEQIPFAPVHVHIADLPRTGVDPADRMLQAFARRLRALGYSGNVSLECSRPAGFDYGGTLDSLRTLFASF